MQQTDPSHVWSERSVKVSRSVAIRVGHRTESMLSRSTNYIDMRASQLLKIGFYYSSPCFGPPKGKSLFSFIHAKCIRGNRFEDRLWAL
jgi:hypothetical protein